MYRCYLTQRGRIIRGEDLDAITLPEAVALGYELLEQLAVANDLDGIEIWEDAKLLYASAGQIQRPTVN
jgi:hypothetical protein